LVERGAEIIAMLAFFHALACVATLFPPTSAKDAGSYLVRKECGPDGIVRTVVEPYTPCEGDLVLFDDHSKMWLILYKCVGSAPPSHAGIVVKLPDGRPALLESGPDDGKLAGYYVCLIDAPSRLDCFNGSLYIRRLRQPLTPQQSACLTEFALNQVGKRYALCRLLLQATPCRCRAPLRRQLFGATYMDRSHWLCAELAIAAGTSCGLFDPKIHKANSMYPLDLYEDHRYDISATYYPPAEWTSQPSETGETR
jgi:hypothetical protein